jgi:ribonuclease P protein component
VAIRQASGSPGIEDGNGANALEESPEKRSRGPDGQRFPKRLRILVRRDFLRIQGQGRRIHGRRLVFQFLPGRTDASRLGITVSKKVGNAVVRNRIKRWVREVFRRHPELRPAGRRWSYDLVITAKSGVTDFSYDSLEAEIISIIERFLGAGPGARGAVRGRPGRPR